MALGVFSVLVLASDCEGHETGLNAIQREEQKKFSGSFYLSDAPGFAYVMLLQFDVISAQFLIILFFGECLRPKPLWSEECAADAMASADICQIGRFIRFPSGTTIWF